MISKCNRILATTSYHYSWMKQILYQQSLQTTLQSLQLTIYFWWDSTWLALLIVHHDSFLTCLLSLLGSRAYLCTTMPIHGKMNHLLSCAQPLHKVVLQ